jgi:putative ABC transport system substrate-binding protein
MHRRAFATLLGATLAAPRHLWAQPAKRVYRIATLDDSVEGTRAHMWRVFHQRLRELVVADGNDVAYEARYARGDTAALPALAAELVALKPDLIVCTGTSPTLAAMKATSAIPIVFATSGAPVSAGLVASLARPGGNVTGISIQSGNIAEKNLELVRELFPKAQRIAYLTDASNKSSVLVYEDLAARASRLKLTVSMFDCRQRAELERSLATIKRERIQALIVSSSGLIVEHREQIASFALREKLPAVYGRREYVDVGGLISYGMDVQHEYRRAAEYVHRIVNGAKPANLPVEQSNTTRMAINMKTARALGIKIPESIKARVDEVIE